MELWTKEHGLTLLPAVAVMLLVTGVLRRWLLKKPHPVRLIPLQIIACILVVLEIGKQAVSLSRGYDLYNLPFHFCSLFIFALPVMALYKGKYRQQVYGVVTALCAAMTLLTLIYPNLIYGAGSVNHYFKDYMSFHTVTFHNLVILAFFLILGLELHTPASKGEGRCVVLFTLGFCVVAATMAQLLKTNYAGFYSCNVPVFESVRVALQPVIGTVPTQIVYVLIIAVLHVAFTYGTYRLYRLLRYLIGKKQTAM